MSGYKSLRRRSGCAEQVLRYGEQEDDEGGENQDVFQVVVEIHMVFKIKVRKEFHGI